MEDYIIQYGDTLEIIAEKQLGNKNRWYEIAQLNNIPSPYQLFIGLKIKLPNKFSVSIIPPSTTKIEFPPATMALARGFLFVIFEQLPEIGSDKVIRKIAAMPNNFSRHPNLSPSLFANITPAQHAIGVKPSQYLSSSNRPYGSPTNVIEGIFDKYGNKSAPSSANPKDFVGKFRGKEIRPVIVDLNKLPPGTRIFTEQELILNLRAYSAETGANVETLIKTIQSVEGEVLIEGGVPKDAVKKVSNVHSAYILTAEELLAKHRLGQITEAELNAELKVLAKSYNRVKMFGRVGRVITVVGVVFTVADVAQASQKSYEKRSYRPIAAETVRQIGGWGGAWAGAQSGAVIGAIFGIELTPVGMVVTGAIGAIFFGALGYFIGDVAAGWIDPPEETVTELRKDVNRVESMRGRAIEITVERNETQYEFGRRALIWAASDAQRESFKTVDQRLPWRFADKFYPVRSSNITKDFKMTWTSGDPSNDKDVR